MAGSPSGARLNWLEEIPVQKDCKVPKYVPLTGIYLEKMRQQWKNVRFLILDEISMVCYELLVFIDRRLKELKQSNEYFGGINIIVCGDLLQLPPVSGHPIYDQPEYMKPAINLWHLFTFCELKENMRQKGDNTFIDLLNNLREGKLTQDQLLLLVEKCENSKQEGIFAPDKAIRVKPTCEMADSHNNLVLSNISDQVKKYKLFATDTFLEQRNEAKDLTHAIPTNPNKTGGLLSEITIFVGAKVMLRYNVKTHEGLVNGSVGTISNIIWPYFRKDQIYDKDLPNLEITFADHIGTHIIEPVTVQFPAKFGYGLIERRMLPIILSYAATVHKLQGDTIDTGVVNLGPKLFAPGQAYTALSRVRTFDGLEIDEIDSKKLIGPNVCNVSALKELERLRSLPPYDQDN